MAPAFWRAIERIGVRPAALLRQARLPATLHLDAQALVTAAQDFATWTALEALTGDPGIGIKLVQATESTGYQPLFLAVCYAADYRDGIARIARFKRLRTPERVHLEALHDSLAQEVAAFGIKVTLVEPGAYATEFGSDTSLKVVPGLAACAELRKRMHERLSSQDRGDPRATAEAILKIVDADNPPLRFALGATILPMARAVYPERLATWEAISNAAQGDATKGSVASF